MCLFLTAALALANVAATDYFVAKSGNDANDGSSKATAFRTIQKGVDVLQTGDVLTIGPGEYSENVRRDKLGGPEKETIIRAELPGTVVLRGDVPVSGFKKVPKTKFTFVVDTPGTPEIQAVNEVDTLTVLDKMPNPGELDFLPGLFHHDVKAGKLYVATSDMKTPDSHRYTASVIPNHGFYLSKPIRVTVAGLTATGFNAAKMMDFRDGTAKSVFGIFMNHPKDCVIRGCRAYLNGRGIGLNSDLQRNLDTGGNLIERCSGWGNATRFNAGTCGGVSVFGAKRDVVRDCAGFLNGAYGVTLYGGGEESQKEKHKSRLINVLAWGNDSADVKIKTGFDNPHTTERSVVMRPTNDYDPEFCLLGSAHNRNVDASNIILDAVADLDPNAEFADPENHDYRLQSTSKFRRAAPGGGDPGPFPFKADVFFVKPNGDDNADGLSLKTAWKTLRQAVENLKNGDTLYLEPGKYAGGMVLNSKRSAENAPISIRGRGLKSPIISGLTSLENVANVSCARIQFDGAVEVAKSADVSFENCLFRGSEIGLSANAVVGLTIRNCDFRGFKDAGLALMDCTGVDLRGNLFDNRRGVAARYSGKDPIVYSHRNGYAVAANAWETNKRKQSLDEVKKGGHDQHSIVVSEPNATIGNGPDGTNIGRHRWKKAKPSRRIVLPPAVHSVSATTANIEWTVSCPIGCQVAWGETPTCENATWFDVNYFGSFSLTGLKPGTTYHVKINALREPSSFRQRVGLAPPPKSIVQLDDAPIAFTTPLENPPAKVYHVAPNGDDANSGLSLDDAWRTIQRAASTVNVGDTVLLAAGIYEERVRIRATGAENAPITFKPAPGAEVVLSGAGEKLANAFIVGKKRHLRFDGFILRDYSHGAAQANVPPGWEPGIAAEFNLYRCADIQITRCLSDGRGGYSAPFLSAVGVDDLLVRNCVFMNKMGGMTLCRCPNVRIANNVFLRPMIASFVLNNTANQKASFHDNIFCGMMGKKAKYNIALAQVEDPAALDLKNNCFMIRKFPPEKRIIFWDVDHAAREITGKQTIAAFDETYGDSKSIFADPEFKRVVELSKTDDKHWDYPPERLLAPDLDIHFDSFFATNPDVVKRGIGLRPEAFEEFHFNEE